VRSLLRQVDEVERVRQQYPGLAILHGVEVDILPDGTLDFADDLLERLDIVLASLHDAAGQGPGRLTRRYLAAMDHPLVNVITHPTNRLVGRRSGYDLEFDRLFAAAAETGTCLEIDGAPLHLDLDGDLARRAIDAGVTVAINSDCHDAGLLERHMAFGVGTARRGWVTAAHVLNARPLSDVRHAIARKRQRLHS
jgi:DNA polymerase (family 10)